MKILIVNDDGINARGIYDLAKEISRKHEVTVVAPREQKSASSHSISIHNPIKIRKENLDKDFEAYSLVGTPADCTQAGLSLLCENVDLVISGINRGLNCGTDILYSGTVSAAIEGSIYNVPAIAFSMEVDWERCDEDYTVAAKIASKIIDKAEEKYLRNNLVLNVNIPKVKEEADNTKKTILEFPIEAGSIADGKYVKDIEWPKDCLLVSLKRGEKEIIPKGKVQLLSGDYLVVIVTLEKRIEIFEEINSITLVN